MVRFPAYRQYERLRVDASNALMGLLAGAQLSNHLLQLNRGSQRLLPEVYPNVPHIRRFNLTTEAASEVLQNADRHLAAMSIAYVLAIHEDYMKTCLKMAAHEGLMDRRRARDARSATQHEELARACAGSFDAVALEQLDTLRLMRNCLVHDGGRASSALVTALEAWSVDARTAWTRIAARSPLPIVHGDGLAFGHGEMLLALAVTKSLDREANVILQRSISRATWVRIAVEDTEAQHPHARRSGQFERKLRGIARHHYAPLCLSRTELAAGLH